MVPLRPEAHEHALTRLGLEETPGLLALRHALQFRRPGLWGDDARKPHGVVLLRPVGDGREAFGAGRADLVVAWLAARQGKLALVAPEDWEPIVRAAVGPVERTEVMTWFDPPLRDPGGPSPAGIRRLGPGPEDAGPFARLAPNWALRGWGSYDEMIRHGAAFAVPFEHGFAAIAWIFDLSARFDALGVFTLPRYRRLGLGRAAARALIRHVQRERGKLPLWSASAENDASLGLARSLGFTGQVSEILLRWPAEDLTEEIEIDR